MSRLPLPIPLEHPTYPDHFPGHTVVPGALLLQWIVDQIKRDASVKAISTVKSVKFLQPVFPGDFCELALSQREHSLNFVCYRQNDLIGKGCVVFSREENAIAPPSL